MTHETITDEERLERKLDNILHREEEVESYQVNIDNYTQILATLPTEWPEDLKEYENMTTDQIAQNVPINRMEEVSDLIYARRVNYLIRTEILEQRKSKQVYNAIIATAQDVVDLPQKLINRKALNKANQTPPEVI